ncbi:hypothetical protein DPMN_004890 [Dreissena polymorpha]|uniref:Uncharacterized protein n=1 Tax=Dreissena polymorpha TaxID=45954 RepID=A0A9D4MPA6_DREPO|nr:hypothetical protein DPMN_004890 [Dreissena polymorpha]
MLRVKVRMRTVTRKQSVGHRRPKRLFQTHNHIQYRSFHPITSNTEVFTIASFANGLQMPQTGHQIKIQDSCALCDTPAQAFVK